MPLNQTLLNFIVNKGDVTLNMTCSLLTGKKICVFKKLLIYKDLLRMVWKRKNSIEWAPLLMEEAILVQTFRKAALAQKHCLQYRYPEEHL